MILTEKEVRESAYELIDDYMKVWFKTYGDYNGLLDVLSEDLEIYNDESEDDSEDIHDEGGEG